MAKEDKYKEINAVKNDKLKALDAASFDSKLQILPVLHLLPSDTQTNRYLIVKVPEMLQHGVPSGLDEIRRKNEKTPRTSHKI